MEPLTINIIAEHPDLIPTPATTGAAGADLRAHIPADVVIPSQRMALIPTGIRVEIPVGYEMQVRPRSGLAFKHQIAVLNSPGTIDSDYRGEIGVMLMNFGPEPFTVTPGMRIAQCVIAAYARAEFIPTQELTATARSGGGFGHTGS